MVKAYFYWRICNPEGGDDAHDLVVADTISKAVEIYLSQYDYLSEGDITKVDRLGSVIIDKDKL